MNNKSLTPKQLTLIKAYDAWFIKKYSNFACEIKLMHNDDDPLVELKITCKHQKPVKN